MKKVNIIICCFLAFTFSVKAQTWYFGNAAGIKFVNTGGIWSTIPAPASPLLNLTNVSTAEGCSVTNDANGDVLLYTDGKYVWDALGNKINDVSGSPVFLTGNSSATQSGLIVPVPDPTPNNKCFEKYFVFGVPDIGTYPGDLGRRCDPNNGISYTVVTYNAGTWTASAVQIISQDANGNNIASVTEKITAIGDVNNGYWILFHGFYNFSSTNNLTRCLVPSTQTDVIGRKFFAIHILPTNTGTVPDPIVSSIDPMISREREHSTYYGNGSQGQMKFSKDGKKVAMVTAFAHQIYVYNFNQTTGQVGSIIFFKDLFTGNATTDDANAPEYGVEFSPNGNYLYVSYQRNTGAPSGKITRIDLLNSPFPETTVLTPSATPVERYSEMQRGPDDNIYVANSAPGSSIIQISNTEAAIPTFTTIPITGTSVFGLPTVVQNEMICGEPDSVPNDTIPQPCCNIPGLNVSLTETDGTTSLTINSGSTVIQEVSVSMMDYHAVYSNPACKPANIGMPGILSSTTTTLGTLAFDNATNNTHILGWGPVTPSVLNNQQINLSITKPLVLQLPCCEVKFYYCLKVRIKDINCNVCEKIVCSNPGDTDHGCGCGKKWVPNSNITYTDVTGLGKGAKIDCFSKVYKGPVAAGSNISYNSVPYQCDKPGCIATYPWKIIDVNSNSIVNSGTATTFPISIPAPAGTGNYEFIVYANCDGKLCDSCGFFFKTKDRVKPCGCGVWKGSTVTYTAVGVKGSVSCGKGIQLSTGPAYTFTAPAYSCSPSNASCQPVYTWLVNGVQQGTGSSFIYAFTAVNNQVKIRVSCGGKICDSCLFEVNTAANTCCPVTCNQSLNQVFDNSATFISTLTSSQLINFATNFDGTPITNPSTQLPLANWNWNGVTFSNCGSYHNTFIYGYPPPNQPMTIKFPACSYKKAGFELSLFNNYPPGDYAIKVYSCDCVYTYLLPGNQAYYFGISLPSAIDKIEISHSTGRHVVDNFRFGN